MQTNPNTNNTSIGILDQLPSHLWASVQLSFYMHVNMEETRGKMRDYLLFLVVGKMRKKIKLKNEGFKNLYYSPDIAEWRCEAELDG